MKQYKNSRISILERADGIVWLNNFEPQNKEQERDKIILKYFLIDGLCGQAIQRLNDPNIVSLGNRNRGKQLSEATILERVYKYFPHFKNRVTRKPGDMRIQHKRLVEKKLIKHIEQCAFCGTRENLESHHMIPLFLGGTNDERNLIFLCKSCHKGVTVYQRSLLKIKEVKENECCPNYQDCRV